MAANLVDNEVLYTEWLPQYLKVVEAHETNEFDLLLLGRIFQVITVTEEPLVVRESGIYSKGPKDAFLNSFEKESAEVETEKADLSRPAMLCLLYKVCCTSPYQVGLEFICDIDLMEKISENKEW